jgi:hypothetical protein
MSSTPLRALAVLPLLSCLAACGGDAGMAGPDAQGAGTYAPVRIGFEDLPVNTIVTTQYAAHATFSTDPTSQITIWNYHDFGTGQYIQTGLTMTYAGYPLYIDFAKPVRHLGFTVLGANSNTACADIRVVHAGATDTLPLTGHGDPTINVSVDLSAYDQISRIEIVNITDFDSISFDELNFEFPNG